MNDTQTPRDEIEIKSTVMSRETVAKSYRGKCLIMHTEDTLLELKVNLLRRRSAAAYMAGSLKTCRTRNPLTQRTVPVLVHARV